VGVAAIVEALEPALSARLVCEVADAVGRLRFSHALVRDTVYGELSALRRATLHARAGEALEQQPGGGGPRLVELAWHFFHAAPVLGPDHGLGYALAAADAAQAAVSYERAEEDLHGALSLVELLPAGPRRWEKELEVQNRLIALMTFTHGFGAPEVARASGRARELCEDIGETDALFTALNNLANSHYMRGDLSVASELGRQLLAVGEQQSSVRWLTAGHLFLGMAQLQSGRALDARETLETLRRSAADLELSDEVAESFFGLHPMAMALMYSARCEWILGEEAPARAFADEGVRLAASLGHPHTLAFAWYFASHLQVLLGDAAGVLERSAAARELCEKHGLAAYENWFRLLEGWAVSRQGRAQEGAEDVAARIAFHQANGGRGNNAFFLSLQAECEARRGNHARALALLEEALAGMGEDRLWESRLHRQRGELLATQGPEQHATAIDSLRTALAVAERQGAAPLAARAMAALAILEPSRNPGGSGVAVGDSSNLTLRERELLGLLGGGLTDKEIAAALVISLATVRSHLDRIRDKTGRRRRPELTRLAMDLGLVNG
jgi:DNA-binding CsgD family transcriptional regulator